MSYKDYLPKNYNPNVNGLGISSAKIEKVAPLKEEETRIKKYGKDYSVDTIKKQAEMTKLQGGDNATTGFLVGAVNDGAISQKEAEDIYGSIPGTSGKLFSAGNLSSAEKYHNTVNDIRKNGVPSWMGELSEKTYGNYTEEEATKKLAELDSKESLTPQERQDFNYLLTKAPAETVKIYRDSAREKTSEESEKWQNSYAGMPEYITYLKETLELTYPEAVTFDFTEKGNFRATLDEEALRDIYKLEDAEINDIISKGGFSRNENGVYEASASAKNLENKYKTTDYTQAIKDKYKVEDIYEAAKWRENVKPYIEEAKADKDFEKIVSSREKQFKKEGDYFGGQADWILDIINGYATINEVTGDARRSMYAIDIDVSSYEEDGRRIAEMTEEEKDIYRYYAMTSPEKDEYGRTKADKYFQALAPTLDKRVTIKHQERMRENAKENPVANYIATPIAKLIDLPTAAGEFINQAFQDEYNHYAPGFLVRNGIDAGHQAVIEEIKSPVGKFFYNVGLSMADSALVMPLGGVGAVFLGMEAAISTGQQVAFSGGSKGEILAKGLAAGIFEAVFEKLSIEKLFNPKAVGSLKDGIITVLKQGGFEASEELATSIANIITDNVVMGGESQFNKLVEQYTLEGLSPSEAQNKAFMEMVGEVGIETLSGFVSGLLFGTGGASGSYIQAKGMGNAVDSVGNTQSVIDYGLMQGEDTSAFKRASELSGKANPKSAKVGALLQQMIIDKQITQAEAQRLVSEGLDGAPLSEGEQAYFYAGASGLSVTEAAELNLDLDVDPERAISAWQKGAEKRNGKPKIKVNRSTIEDAVMRDEIKRQADSVPGAKAGIKTWAKTVSYTPENKKGPEAISGAKELKDENYRVAAEKYRTEENGKEFDLAYSLGLTGEEITGLSLTNISDDARIAAYFAGRHDASSLAEKRRAFEGRRPGVSQDGVTAAILSRYSKRTREVIDTIGKKLGVEIRLVTRSSDRENPNDSLYNYSKGVVEININEKHNNLKGDKLIRFIVTHEAIHRIMETSPKTYKEMEKIALSKSETTIEEKMAEYECSREDAIEEIVADYFGDLLSSKSEIRTLMNEHRNVFDVIYEAIEWLCNKLRGTGVAFSEMAEARKLFKEALSEADSNVWGKEVRSEGEAVRSENVKWSLSKNAERDVKAALDDVSIGGDIQLTNSTPSIMLGHKDVNNFPLWMKASHIRENIFTEAEAKAKGLKINKNTNYHGLGDKLFLRIIDSLDDVTLAYRGTKNAENPDRRENYFLLITEMKDGEGNVVNVPVYINESRKINKNFVKVNLVATAYGKKNLEDYIKRELNKGNLVRIKNRSIQSSEAASPINADYRMDASKDNIPQKSGVVNTYSMQEKENYADIKRSKSDDGERTFSYDELVAKGDIKGVVIKKNQQIKLTADGEVDVVSLMKEIHEKCEKIETKSKEPTYYIEVPDISRNVVIARKGVEHGFIKNLLSNGAKFPPTEKLNATVSLELPEILKNSIEVNLSFRDRSADVPYTHVMLGTVAMENEDGTVDYYAVRMMVEEKINQGAILTEANILGKLKAINTKKVGLPQARVIEDDVALTSSKSYAYSVADLLEDVKSEFNDTFSLDVYEKLGMKRHENEFSDNLLYSKSDTDVKYFPPGEKPRRAIDVPSEIDGEKVRRFARTAAEAPAVSDEIAEDVVSEIENGRFFYEQSSNATLIAAAEALIEDGRAERIWSAVTEGKKVATDLDIAVGEALLVKASNEGDSRTAMKLISEIAIEGTRAGKVVQAMKLLKRMTPEGQVYYLEKSVEKINEARGKKKGEEFNEALRAENRERATEKALEKAEANEKAQKKKVADLEAAIREATEELTLESEISEASESLKNLREELTDAKRQTKNKDANSKKLSEQIEEVKRQIAEAEKNLKEATEKRNALYEERKKAGAENSAIKKNIKATEKATEKLLGRIEILESEISEAKDRYEKAKAFADELSEERKKLKRERDSLKKKIASAEKASERDVKKIADFESEIRELSEKYAGAKRVADGLAENRRNLTEERNRLKNEFEKTERKGARESRKIEKLREKIASLLNDLHEADRELAKAKKKTDIARQIKDKAAKMARAAQSKAGKVELPESIKKAILESKTEEELRENVDFATDYIAANMTATWGEKVKAWRYTMMLGNIRTQGRNFIGNAIMLLPTMTKNVIATPLEFITVSGYNKLLESKGERMLKEGYTQEEVNQYIEDNRAYRTKTITFLKKKSEEIRDFADKSWEENSKLAMQGAKYDDVKDGINEKRRIFKSDVFESYRKATSWAMEKGDEIFLKINYKQAITSFMLSNKLTPDTITEAQKLRAEQYAIKEAREATFRDKSKIAEALNKVKGVNWATELFLGGLIPFTTTPINVTKRAFEYSPLGIIKVASDIANFKGGKVEINEVVNSLAKLVTGSALTYLGFVLAAKGLLRAVGDDDEEEYDYLIGEQDYALKIGDYRYTIEWASPSAIPLLLGGAIWQSFYGKKGGMREEFFVDENGTLQLNTSYMKVGDVMNSVINLFSPIFDATYLSGLSDALEAGGSFSSNPGEAVTAFLVESVLSFGGQFIPTWLGQLARTIDSSERRNNDYDRTNPLPYQVQKGIAKIKNKIPFLNQTSTPYVNAWGEEEIKQGAIDYILSGVENFISPGYIEKVSDDELTSELWRLENTEAAKDKKIFPEAVPYSFTEDEKKYTFNPEQHNEYQKVTGKTARELISGFVDSDVYGDLTDEERAEAVNILWKYANAEGVKAVYPDYTSKDSNVVKLNFAKDNVGVQPVDYALWKIAVEKADYFGEDDRKGYGNGSINQDEADQALGIFADMTDSDIKEVALAYLWQMQTDGVSKNNPYGYALRGTPWYRANGKDYNNKLWMKPKE